MIADPIDFRNRERSTLDYAGQRVLFIVDGMIEFADFRGKFNHSINNEQNTLSGVIQC